MSRPLKPSRVVNDVPIMPTSGQLSRVLPIALGCSLILVAVWLGISARFMGLNLLQLAEDEYYFVRGVQSILEHGVPLFATGGYYVHGLLAQYATAASVVILGEGGFAYRVPAVLFSLGSVVLLYIYSRRFLETIPAGLVCAMLLVSAWHIEFARFIRMYSQFQFFTLLFLIVFDKTFFEGRWRWRYLPHVVAILAFLTHSLGLLLLPLLFLPLVLADMRRRFLTWASIFWFAFLTTVTVVFCCSFVKFDFLRQGVSNPLPEGYVFPLPSSSQFRVPEFPFWSISDDALLNLIFFLAVCALVVAVLAARHYFDRRVTVTDVILALLVITALFHMFVVSFGLVLLLIFRYQFYRLDVQPRRSYVMLYAAFVIGASWIAHALLSTEWVNLAGGGERILFKTLGRTFFGWPDFYHPVFVPWFKELPTLGLIAFAGLAYQIATRIKDPPSLLLRNPAFIVCYIALCFGVLRSEYPSTRYAFFIYPLILLVVALSTLEFFGKISQVFQRYERSSVQAWVALGCLGLFICAEDFNFRQITNISSERVRFRLGDFQRYTNTWYFRADYESPAKFVAAAANDDHATRIIVVGLAPISYYLSRSHALYYDRNGRLFYNISRIGGTVDLWSNQRLLSTAKELQAYTQCSTRVLIIQSKSEKRSLELDDIWKNRLLRAERAYNSIDGRIEVIAVQLRPDSAGADDCRNTENFTAG
jgi:Dolichyl-phosphate-mannose-protein mannosyltransferase